MNLHDCCIVSANYRYCQKFKTGHTDATFRKYDLYDALPDDVYEHIESFTVTLSPIVAFENMYPSSVLTPTTYNIAQK